MLQIRDECHAIAAFELNDSIVVTKNSVNLGFDSKACLLVDVWALVMRVFEYCVLIDTTQKQLKLEATIVVTPGGGVVTYDLDFQIRGHPKES